MFDLGDGVWLILVCVYLVGLVLVWVSELAVAGLTW